MAADVKSNGYPLNVAGTIPPVRTFQMDEISIGKASESVNVFRGDVNIPLNLVSLPGRDGLDVSLDILYQSNVQAFVDTWNLELPAGILGLGWSVDYEMIAVDNKKNGYRYDDAFYLVSGGGANRLYLLEILDDYWSFEAENYDFEDIRYYFKEEKWIITKKNGVRNIYGGAAAGAEEINSPLQYAVKWGGARGNWVGDSRQTAGQRQIVIAWNLSETRSMWGDKITYEYENEMGNVGGAEGLKYTSASCLKKIRTSFDKTVELVYGQKEKREIQPPHECPDAGINAYQDRYGTRYLDSILVNVRPAKAEAESLLFKIIFRYRIENNSPDQGNDNFCKRYLESIIMQNPQAESLPGFLFDYYGYSEDPKISKGALKSILYPQGGIVTYTYEKIALPGASHKGTAYGTGKPRVWFGNDYVVITWYDEGGGRLSVDAYSWNGSWVPFSSGFSASLKSIDTLRVIPGDQFFALSYVNNKKQMMLYLYNKQKGIFGKWGYNVYYLDLDSDDAQTVLTAGTNFVVALASGGKKLCKLWNQKNQGWDDKTFGLSRADKYALAAGNNFLTAACYDSKAKTCELQLFYLDEMDRNFNAADLPDSKITEIEWLDEAAPEIFWSLGGDYAAATFIKNKNIDYEVRVYQWDDVFKAGLAVRETYRAEQDSKDPFYYSAAAESLVGNLGNLFRYNGVEWKAGKLNVPQGGGITRKYAYGSDTAIVSTYQTNDIRIFSPCRDYWTVPSRVPDGGGKKDDPFIPTISGNFITAGRRILYKNSEGGLTLLNDFLDAELEPSSIMNRGPFYIAGQTPEGSTKIYLLKNGKVEKVETPQGRIFVAEESIRGRQGTILAGPAAFVTYAGNSLDSASHLTLYKVIEASIETTLFDYSVTRVTVNDGYRETYASYNYTGNVTTGPFGITSQYSAAEVIHGSADSGKTPFGKTEFCFINGADKYSGTEMREFLHGMLYRKTVYDADGLEREQENNKWDVLVTRMPMSGPQKEINLFGGCVQAKSQESRLFDKPLAADADAGQAPENAPIVKKAEYECSPQTGLPVSETTYNRNSKGEPETLRTYYSYAWEQYDELKDNHIWSPQIQVKETVNDQTVSLEAVTWKKWADGDASQGILKWASFRTYRARKENAVFDDWNNTNPPSEDEWLKTSEVISRTGYGAVQEVADIGNVHACVIFDAGKKFPVAQAVNAGTLETAYAGFEDYESREGWELKGGPKSWDESVIKGDAHTGFQSFELFPDADAVLEKTVRISGQNRGKPFILSCWIKTEEGFGADAGQAGWKFSGTAVPIEDTGAQWKFWHCTVNPEGDEISLRLFNHKKSKYLLVDDIFFGPLAGSLQSTVYHPVSGYPIAEVGINSSTGKTIYDQFYRNIARTGPCGNVNSVTASWMCRQAEDAQPFVFPGNTPNSKIMIAANGGGVYENFMEGARWRDKWQAENRDNWNVVLNEDGAELEHAAETEHPDVISYLPAESLTNFGVRVLVRQPGPAAKTIGLCVGNAKVEWLPGKGWSLNGGPAENSPFGRDWILSVSDKTLIFLADGRQVFSRHTDEAPGGKLQLIAGGRVSFKDIVIFENPSLSAAFTDGTDKELQTQALNGTDCIISGSWYDELGRQGAVTKHMRGGGLFGFRESFIRTFDPVSGVMTGDITDYYSAGGGGYSDDHGYPYSRTVFEDFPLSRRLKKGLPGKEFAIVRKTDGGKIIDENPHIETMEYGINIQGTFGDDPCPSGEYYVEKTSDANGNPSYTLTDKRGNVIASRTALLAPDRSAAVISRTIYDARGNAVMELKPNCFFPPQGSKKEDWMTVNEYDYLNQLISTSSPDTGTVKYLYDKAGRLRFMMDAQENAEKRITYRKYDVLGRPVEEGWFSGEWNVPELQDKADHDPDYPSAEYTWTKKNYYDGDGSNPCLIGKLSAVSASNAGNKEDAAESYEYDRLGNMTGKTLKVTDFDGAERNVRQSYNNTGKVLSVSYPPGATDREIVYAYNALGEIISAGTPDDREKFAVYAYNADGGIESVRMNKNGEKPVLQTYSYESPGWIKNISGKLGETPVFGEILSYTSGGFEGAAFFNGNIASETFQRDRSIQCRFGYDGADRLNAVQSPAGTGEGSPAGYDVNGNIIAMNSGGKQTVYQYYDPLAKRYSNRLQGILDPDGSRNDAFVYDLNGNVVSAARKKISRIAYGPGSRKVSAIDFNNGSPQSLSFRYDGSDARVLKILRNGEGKEISAKLYIHGMNDYPLAEETRDGKTVQYIYAQGGLLAFFKEDKLYMVIKDNLGSTRMVLDEQGKIMGQYDYLPFGDFLENPSGSNPGIIDYLYTGQELDREISLYNYRARFYDSGAGRFYAVDPGDQYFSPYCYVDNDPVNDIDPTGEFGFLAALGIAILIGAIIGGASYAIEKAVKKEEFDWDEFGIAVGIGAVAGAVGFGAGSAAASAAVRLGAGVVMEGIVAGAVGGAAGSAAGQISGNLIRGEDWDNNVLSATLFGAATGALLGGTLGAYSRYLGKLRAGYVRDVGNLARVNQNLQNAGVSLRNRAVTLAAMRRGIGRFYKARTLQPVRKIIFYRNMRDYGDQWGPTWQWLIQRNTARYPGNIRAAWLHITQSSSRTSRFWTAIAPERNWTALLNGSWFPARQYSKWNSGEF